MPNNENEKRGARSHANDAMTTEHLAKKLEQQEPVVLRFMTTQHTAERLRKTATETADTNAQKPSENKDKTK
jgi:hypothetical protein